MIRPSSLAFLAAPLLALLLAPVQAATTIPASTGNTSTAVGSCGWSNLCLANHPCCSEFGFCGSGTACLGGCNPAGSTAPGYCAPVPVCASANYTFLDDSRIMKTISGYTGDASLYDFTLDAQDGSKTPIIQNGELALVLTQNGGGTRLSTTRSFLYGNISASIKTTSAIGVVTAFITMSGVKDEIDFEWTGNQTNEAQTNYYWEGDVAGYTHGDTSVAKNRASSYLVYGIVWTPDVLEWTVNGAVVRTLTRASTLDPTIAGLYHYPQTPSRIQLSVWPAGISTSPPGTISWSGGLIDWTSAAYTSVGYYAAYFQWIAISCYSDSSLPYISSNSSTTTNTTSSMRARSFDLVERANVMNSYLWGTNNTAGQIQIAGSDASTIINSPFSTGMQMIVAKGVTSVGGTSNGQAAGTTNNWWTNLPLGARIGIIVGGVAVFLILLIMTCTCYARRQDKKKYAAVAAASAPRRGDHIPLVEKVEKPEGAGPSWTAQQAARAQQHDYASPPRSNSYQSSMAPSRNESYGGGYSPQPGQYYGAPLPQQHQYQTPQYYNAPQQSPPPQQYYVPQTAYGQQYGGERVASPGPGYGATQGQGGQQAYGQPPQWPQGRY